MADGISQRLLMINELNGPSLLESSTGQRVAYTASAFLMLFGLLFHTYVPLGLGALVAFCALVAFDGRP